MVLALPVRGRQAERGVRRLTFDLKYLKFLALLW
jgi:hypothetical protein